MAVNAWANTLCLMCKSPLIVVDETRLCTTCKEKIKKMQYDLRHRKKPKPQNDPRKVWVVKHK